MAATRRVLNTKSTVSGWKTGLPGSGGGGQGGPSVLSRVMDTISRGNYAMAEGARRTLYTDKAHPSSMNMAGNPLEFMKGFGAGITGKKKTTFSDVLEQGGVKNPWLKGIAGFGLDIALDPTTYLTLGAGAVAKNALGGAAKIAKGAEAANAGVKAIEEAGKLGKVAKAIGTGEKVAEAAGAAQKVSAAAGAGEKVAQATGTAQKVLEASQIATRPVGKDVIQAASQVVDKSAPLRYAPGAGKAAEETATLGSRAAEATQAAGKATESGAARAGAGVTSALPDPLTAGTFGLKFMGVPIKGLQSEKLYNLGKGAQGAMRASKAGRLLGETFDVGHGLSPEVANLQRISSGVGRQRVDEFAQEVHTVFHGISKENQKVVKSAVNDGTWRTLPPELRDAAEKSVNMLNEMNKLSGGVSKAGKTATKDIKFEDIFPFKGADKPLERAPQALVAQYDRVVRKHQYGQFIDEVNKRFPDAVHNAEVQKALHKTREIFGVDGEVSAKWQHYMNAVQAPWRRWVTSYRPGFHVRNMLGDSFNAYLAGTRAKYFGMSGRVLGDTADDVTEIVLGGRRFTKAEAERMYRKGGLETSFIEAEVVGGKDRGLAHTVTQFGEKREKFTRMATFLDSMDRGISRGMSVDKAIEEASMRVRKYHFDYTALTPAERKLRTFIPFYTYTRKEMPVILEHTLTSPGKMNRVPKATNALQNMLGVQHDPNNPFPGIDAVLPEYLKNQGIVQMGRNRVLAPGNPSDMINSFSPKGFADTVSQGLSPLIKIPYETMSGERVGGGKQTQSLMRYLASQGMYGTMFRDSKIPLSERLIALLSGSGYKNIQP